jgi:hypothetical protein
MSGEGLGVFVACATLLLLGLQAARRRPRTGHAIPSGGGGVGVGAAKACEGRAVAFAALNSASQQHFAHRDRRALVDSELHALVDSGAFQFHLTHPVPCPVDLHSYVQPASIDLPVTGSAFLVKVMTSSLARARALCTHVRFVQM